MGTYALVTIAEGRLRSSPKNNPTAQPGQGSSTQPRTRPMAKRSAKAPRSAVRLSGKDRGSIIPTATAPKTRPAITPHSGFDIARPPVQGIRVHGSLLDQL